MNETTKYKCFRKLSGQTEKSNANFRPKNDSSKSGGEIKPQISKYLTLKFEISKICKFLLWV